MGVGWDVEWQSIRLRKVYVGLLRWRRYSKMFVRKHVNIDGYFMCWGCKYLVWVHYADLVLRFPWEQGRWIYEIAKVSVALDHMGGCRCTSRAKVHFHLARLMEPRDGIPEEGKVPPSNKGYPLPKVDRCLEYITQEDLVGMLL